MKPTTLILTVGLAFAFWTWARGPEPLHPPYTLKRTTDQLLLASPSGWETVSMLDGGRTGLYYDVAEDLLVAMPRIERVALLGLGGGEMLRAAHRAQPAAHLVGVEIDPHTAALAWDDFGMSRLGVEMVLGDAVEWIAVQPHNALDVVMVDLFDDATMVPESTRDPFLSNCARALRPYGLFIMNVNPSERANEIEARLAPYFITAQKRYDGECTVITGMRKP